MKALAETWRWFGPKDIVTLSDIKQTGATGIVSALHHLNPGELWTVEEIQQYKARIERAGLRWTVVESVPIHENIKQQVGNYEELIANYQQTLRNLAKCGIHIICYNFMPVLDWTRTTLDYPLSDDSWVLRFEKKAHVAFDAFILQRPGAYKEYSEEELAAAESYFESLSESGRQQLSDAILLGLPGTVEDLTLDDFRKKLAEYDNIDQVKLFQHYRDFLSAVIPVAEEVGSFMAVHPDDPPFPLFGIPRIVNNADNMNQVLQAVDSVANGLTFCTGSLGAHPTNDLVAMAKSFADRIHFVHLRNVKKDPDGSFNENPHLDGDVDMYEVMKVLMHENAKRMDQGADRIPMRPDHGGQLLDDKHKKTYSGYSAIGRLKGLAELRGLALGIERSSS